MSKDKKDGMNHDQYFEDDGYDGFNDQDDEQEEQVHDKAYYFLKCCLVIMAGVTGAMFVVIMLF